jgi:TorA maturation chaperone TorD
MLKGFLEHLTESTLTDLAVDYARIFLGAGGTENRTYPYESLYTGPDRLMMQDARDQVLKLYRDEGLSRAEEFNEPEDHIAFELEFMSYLCQKTTEALNDGDKNKVLGYLKKQQGFLDKHLLPWVLPLQLLAREDFYKAVAKITIGYLSMEKDLIGEMVDEIQG